MPEYRCIGRDFFSMLRMGMGCSISNLRGERITTCCFVDSLYPYSWLTPAVVVKGPMQMVSLNFGVAIVSISGQRTFTQLMENNPFLLLNVSSRVKQGDTLPLRCLGLYRDGKRIKKWFVHKYKGDLHYRFFFEYTNGYPTLVHVDEKMDDTYDVAKEIHIKRASYE